MSLKFNPDDVYVDGIYYHTRKLFYLVFNSLFKALCDGVYGYAVFDYYVYVNKNPISVSGYLHTLTVVLSF